MSRTGSYAKDTARALVFTAGILTVATPLSIHAQYVGHVDSADNSSSPTLRATAVVEYTGDLTKPTASRLIPIAVWDGERYQPGGLYLAQPVPLTVQFGTQYMLQVAGTPKGFYDVKAASDVGGSWIATGAYQKPTTPKVANLKRSRSLPRIVSDADDDKPHFAHVPTADTSAGGQSAGSSGTKTSSTSATPVDPDRPTLHKRADDGSSQSTSTGADASSGTSTASNSAPSVDPDRPTLHRSSSPTTVASDDGAPVSASNITDPDRPRLEYGRPKDLEALDAPSAVAIKNLASASTDNLEQIAAISDTKSSQPHSYIYSWLDPDDEKKAQTALEAVAQEAFAKSAQSVTSTGTKSANAAKTATISGTAHRAPTRKATKPALPPLSDEQFKAYALSFGSGATLVFTATTGEGDAARYVTLIAQPDFNGVPIVLFKQVVAARDLDITPRMKLVDAVDTDGDNRAELIFALENKTRRQYAIYRIANNTVEQVFTTGS